MTDPELTGGCACGAVRYAVEPPLGEASYCHCKRCQRRTGTAASANVGVTDGTLRWTAGEEHIRRWTPEGGYTKAFCGLCGSALFSESPSAPGTNIGLRLGSFDQDPSVRPALRQWVSSAAPWEPVPDDGLPRYEETRPSRTG